MPDFEIALLCFSYLLRKIDELWGSYEDSNGSCFLCFVLRMRLLILIRFLGRGSLGYSASWISSYSLLNGKVTSGGFIGIIGTRTLFEAWLVSESLIKDDGVTFDN